MDSVLELINAELVKSVATFLDRVYWKTETGQRWVVLGPSDVGKTSLVHAASDRLSLNRGDVTLDSQDLKGIDPAELATRVALVSKFSAPLICGGQRVPDFVHTAAWGIDTHQGEEYKAEDEARCQDLFKVLGISHLAQHELHTLSKGKVQRIPPTRSLTSDLGVLTLDKPGTDLDLGARELPLSTLEEIMSDTYALQAVLVTRQMEGIPAGITHAMIMAKGRIIAQGPIDETLTGVNLSHVYELPLGVGCDVGCWQAYDLKRS